MDFLKILKSFEDFVYEALIWLILLPQTLLRIVFSPRRMASYAERELASADDEQRDEARTWCLSQLSSEALLALRLSC
ncbi:hypothetical protein [Xanthomonas theicola]|nr:hypothetical protein [Xanthomonas theicola]QNH23655.1 hypothetical protein G4Q83_01180 [Xanthomonas theicola]